MQRIVDTQIVQDDFDRIALLDEENWSHNVHYHSFLLKQVPLPCENALEIGCGAGAFARLLAKHTEHVLGLDLSPQMVRLAKERSDSYLTVLQVRKICNAVLPGAKVSKHLFWRYSLVWKKA